MIDENDLHSQEEILSKGKRIFFQLSIGSLLIGVGVIAEEIITMNTPKFIIGLGILFPLIALLWWLVARGKSLRWILFGVILIAGAYTFLLGGLHMKNMQEEPIDPICYWLAACGLALIGIGGFSAYSPELDLYFKCLLKPKKQSVD